MFENFVTWFLIFIFYSFAGWVMEVVLSIFQQRKFINRGFLVGPLCPIYGTGALILSALINPNESLLVIFCVSLVSCATLEYFASFAMEKLFRVRWWDYSDWPFNLEGRICLFPSLMFGVGGVLILKVVTPFLLGVLGVLPLEMLYAFAGAIGVVLACDFCLSLWLILGVRVTVGTVARDATDEISERVREILMGKGKLSRRLMKAFPKQKASPKRRKRK